MKIIKVIEILNPNQINSVCTKRGDLFISKDSRYVYFDLKKAKKDGFLISKIAIFGIPIRLRMSTNIKTFKINKYGKI